MQVFITWRKKRFHIRRLVISGMLMDANDIRAEAQRLSLPVVLDDEKTVPQPGDLWVGLWPVNGYGGVEDECGEARNIEASRVLEGLRFAEVK